MTKPYYLDKLVRLIDKGIVDIADVKNSEYKTEAQKKIKKK